MLTALLLAISVLFIYTTKEENINNTLTSILSSIKLVHSNQPIQTLFLKRITDMTVQSQAFSGKALIIYITIHRQEAPISILSCRKAPKHGKCRLTSIQKKTMVFSVSHGRRLRSSNYLANFDSFAKVSFLQNLYFLGLVGTIQLKKYIFKQLSGVSV